MTLLFVAGLVLFILSLFMLLTFLGLWTYKDAQVKSEHPPAAWALAAVFIPNAMGFIAYLLIGRAKKDVPAPGTFKKALISSVVVFVLSLVLFVAGTINFALGGSDLGGNVSITRGTWIGRSVSFRNNQWTENVSRGSGTSQRTVTLNAEQLQNFHIESTSEEGILDIVFEQGANSVIIDVSFDYFGTIDLLNDHNFLPGRVRITLQYEQIRRARTILNWQVP
jgi:hypothetical protein